MRIVTYTCITNNYEGPKNPPRPEGSQWFLFTDDPGMDLRGTPWRPKGIREYKFTNPQHEARWYKIAAPYVHFPDADYWVWIDASITPLISIPELIERYPGDLVAFSHPDRMCAYDEGLEIKACNLAPHWLVDVQMSTYRREGFPANFGLVETKVVIRKNTSYNWHFSRLWLAEVLAFTHRDQLSFDYVRWRTGAAVTHIDPATYRGVGPQLFYYKKHEDKRVRY
jgi:hypothetical protein